MHGAIITPDTIAHMLTRIAQGRGGRPFMEFDLADPRVAWHHLRGVGNGDLPAIDHGQDRDIRYSLYDGRSLHVHLFSRRRVARFHVDQVDPRRDELGHVIRDTDVVGGAGLGAAMALALGATPVGLIAGIVLGGVAAVIADSPPVRVWRLSYFDRMGRWRARLHPVAA